MPKFFFHHRIGDERMYDHEGDELLDVREARREAIHDARHLMGDQLLQGNMPKLGVVEICDENGRKVDQISYIDALFA